MTNLYGSPYNHEPVSGMTAGGEVVIFPVTAGMNPVLVKPPSGNSEDTSIQLYVSPDLVGAVSACDQKGDKRGKFRPAQIVDVEAVCRAENVRNAKDGTPVKYPTVPEV